MGVIWPDQRLTIGHADGWIDLYVELENTFKRSALESFARIEANPNMGNIDLR
jgi:hypothetical protein